MKFTLVLEEQDNIVCTNGFYLIRPKTPDDLLIIFGNLFTEEFKIQHQSLTRGSIMEGISDTDIENILINEDIDVVKYKKIIDAMKLLKIELTSL